MKVSLEQQIQEHRATIAMLTKRIAILDVCNMPKSAAHWRAMIAACESCIRACERRLAS